MSRTIKTLPPEVRALFKTDPKAYWRAYRQANRDKVAEQKRAYRQANRDKVAGYQRAYYQANRDKVAEQKRAYYQANRDKVAGYQRAYRQANRAKLKLRAIQRREAKLAVESRKLA